LVRLLHMLVEEFKDVVGDLVAVLFQRKVSSIEQMNFCVRHVTLESFRSRRGKNRIVFSPDDEHGWFHFAQCLVPKVILFRVVPIVIKQSELNFVTAWLV
jgi:hypothetical protein